MVPQLISLATQGSSSVKTWAKIALGSLPSNEVNSRLNDSELAAELFPLQQLSPSENWTKREKSNEEIIFLGKQSVY
jgi:hypothetical protein